ncbi:MAG: RDD family protein [Bdellovibrionales bacterium]|nr:RDD family protein [Bdellovibrionales bacterium]
MVIEDQYAQKTTKEDQSETGEVRHRSSRLRLASPLDRLAAVIVDLFLVIFPVSALVGAPFKREIMKALILQDETEFAFYLVMITLSSGLVVIVYQTLMVWLFGGTLGKMFWGLRVERLWKHRRPTFTAALLRSVFWLFDSLLAMVPHLAVFSNEKRRPFHDRVSDTVVVTIKNREARSPGIIEASFVHGVVAAFAVFMVIFLTFSSFDYYLDAKSKDPLVSSLEEDGSLCSSVGEAAEDWPTVDGETPDRLQVAMALFAAGEVAKSCLSAEVDLKLVREGEESPLAYLAQSFVHADNAELSDRYLARVCELAPDSDSCKMSEVVSLWTEEKWNEVESIFGALDKTQEHYIFVWAVRHYVRRGDFHLASKYLEKIEPRRGLGSFLGMQRAKAYWGLRRLEESRAAAAVAFETLGPAERIDLASWMCYEEVEASCQGVLQKSCQLLEKAVADSGEFLLDAKVALSYIKQNECRKGYGKSYDELARNIPLVPARRLLFAYNLRSKDQVAEGRQVLWELVNDSATEEEFREEARHLLVQWSTRAEDLEALRNDWAKEKQNQNWRKFGLHLVRGYFELGDYQRAFSVVEILGDRIYTDQKVGQQAILAAYHLGKRQEAWGLLQKLNPAAPAEDQSRRPASADSGEFEMIAQGLKKEFAGK